MGDDSCSISTVHIALTKAVGDLKELIKAKKKPDFDDVPADSLKLWKVSVLILMIAC